MLRAVLTSLLLTCFLNSLSELAGLHRQQVESAILTYGNYQSRSLLTADFALACS